MSDSIMDLEDKVLVQTLSEKETALVRARFSHAMGRLENTASLRVIRKDIARIRTEVRRRELAQGLAKDALVAQYRTRVTGAGAGESSSAGGFLKGLVDKVDATE